MFRNFRHCNRFFYELLTLLEREIALTIGLIISASLCGVRGIRTPEPLLATTRFASVAFYADEVFKADGEMYMYATYDDPKERATIVGFDKRSIVLPIRSKGIGAIVSAEKSA